MQSACMVMWTTGCAQLLAPDRPAGEGLEQSALTPATRGLRLAVVKERMFAAGALLGLIAMLALVYFQ